jgi:hypothetical protein
MMNISESAKRDLISAFQDAEDGDDFLVAKDVETHADEYLTEEEKYVQIKTYKV